MKAERTNLSRRVEAALSLTLPIGISHDLLNEIDRLTRDREALLEAAMEFVQWDVEHDGIYSAHNPAVRRLLEKTKSAIAKSEEK